MKKLLFLSLLVSTIFAADSMQVFKPATTTCPPEWLEEMKKITDEVDVISMMNVRNLKRRVGVPRELQSCNTSILKDYIFEGNVPAPAIKEFFKDIPEKSIGLAMPANQNEKEIKTVYVIFEDKSYKEFGKF